MAEMQVTSQFATEMPQAGGLSRADRDVFGDKAARDPKTGRIVEQGVGSPAQPTLQHALAWFNAAQRAHNKAEMKSASELIRKFDPAQVPVMTDAKPDKDQF